MNNKSISGAGTSNRSTKECLSIKGYLAAKILSSTNALMNSGATLSPGTQTREAYHRLQKSDVKTKIPTQPMIQ